VEEVNQAKAFLVGGFPLGTSTLSAVASRWLAGYTYELAPEYLNEFIPKVNAVTTEQVLAAVSKNFNLDHLVITVAGDAAEIKKSLDPAQLKSVVNLDVKRLM
jgi:zinc protease